MLIWAKEKLRRRQGLFSYIAQIRISKAVYEGNRINRVRIVPTGASKTWTTL
jgi:hypothetical protein